MSRRWGDEAGASAVKRMCNVRLDPAGEKMAGVWGQRMSGHRSMAKTVALLCGGVVFVSAVFAMAGSLEWWNLWVLLMIMAGLGWATVMATHRWPGLAEERRTASSKAQPWDLVLVRLVNLAMPATLVVAALDQRFRWLPAVPLAASAAAFVAMVAAATITYRAMAVNPFFSSYVRIQEDRGHTVVAAGPYGVVRHPGYAGAVLFNLLVPVVLGSWTAILVGAGAGLLLAYRTAREDCILAAQLPGYTEYAKQVPSRIIPGLW